MIDLSDITVIIRSAGERTVKACETLLQDVFAAEQIKIIEEVPFSQAVRRSLEIGIEVKKPWLLCIDADVLIDKDGVFNLLKNASEAPKEVFEVQGLILDKFFPVFRPAGNHLYRTAYAEKALKMIPQEGATLRPEATLLKNMAMAGYPWMQCDAVVGIHDFEQYYRDIFRKCFLQGKKHKELISYILDYWLKQSLTDEDFKVGLLGLLYGLNHNGTVLVDKRFEENRINDILNQQNIQEKSNNLNVISENVLTCIEAFDTKQFVDLQGIMMPEEFINKPIIINSPSKFNFAARTLYKLGNMFLKVGDIFRKQAMLLTK